MREIKFRVYDKKNKEFLEEEYLHRNGGFFYTYGVGFHSEDEFALMQYTGLKDKNGKEIYEDDFLEVRGKQFRVYYNNGGFNLLLLNHPTGEYPSYPLQEMMERVFTDDNTTFMQNVEIIGNVYESPSILK